MKLKRIIVLTALAMHAAMLPAYTQRQTPTPQQAEEAMRRHREKTRGTIGIQQALFGLLRDQATPGGLVILPQCGEEARVKMSVGTSLQEILDSLSVVAPQYRWESDNSVVNVVPKEEIPPLLNIRVARFRAQNMRTPDEALSNLLDNAEVREAMTRPDVGWRLFRGRLGYYDPSPAASGNVKLFSVSRDNVTVREALNTIASAYGRAMWTYRGNNCRGVNSFELDFQAW